jgi:proteasome alpha subunit
MDETQHQQMGYDRAATMFAPDGHILQVEYAEKIVRLGSASIGWVYKNGVVIVSDRRQNDSLVVSKSADKISEIDDHVICVSAGIGSDTRVLVDKARVAAQKHRLTFDSPIAIESLVKEIADIEQQFSQYGGARPFGVNVMFAGTLEGEIYLYITDVTGNYLRYFADAIGENDSKIKDKLRADYKKDLGLNESVKKILTIFKEVQGEDFNKDRFDIAYVENDKISYMNSSEIKI